MDQPKGMVLNSFTTQDIQTEIMFFKDEVLRDFKKAELQIKARIEKATMETEKKMAIIQERMQGMENKIADMTAIVNVNNNKMDRIDKLITFKESIEDKMSHIEFKIKSNAKDMLDACFRYDKLINNNLLIPGLIGDHCKYPNMKEYIQWSMNQLSVLNTQKDKSILEFKTTKEKIEGTINFFNVLIDRVKANFTDLCRQSVQECKDHFDQRISITDQMVEDMKLANGAAAIELKSESSRIYLDWMKIMNIKEDIYQKFDKGIEEYKNINKITIDSCSDNQTEFKIIKKKFTELSEFIKDVRFRRNLNPDLKRRDMINLSKKITFDRNLNNAKTTKILDFDEDNLSLKKYHHPIKDDNGDLFLYEPNYYETDNIRKLNFTPSDSGLNGERLDENTSTYSGNILKERNHLLNDLKPVDSKQQKSKIKNKINLMGNIVCHCNSNSNNNIHCKCKKTKTPEIRSKKGIIKENQLLSSTPILLNECTDNSKDNTKKLNDEKSIKDTGGKYSGNKLNDEKSIKDTGNKTKENRLGNFKAIQIHQIPSLNNNPMSQALINKTRLKNESQKDNDVYLFNHNDSNQLKIKPTHQNKIESEDFITKNNLDCHQKINSNSQRFCNTHQSKEKTNYYPEVLENPNGEFLQEMNEKLRMIEAKMLQLEYNSNHKMEDMMKYIKKLIITLENDQGIPSTKIQLLRNPSGVFVPFSFDDKKLDNYFPQAGKKNVGCGKSQNERKKISDLNLLTQRRKPLPLKLGNKFKSIADDFRQTFSSLSVLMTNNPKVFQHNDSNLLLNNMDNFDQINEQTES